MDTTYECLNIVLSELVLSKAQGGLLATYKVNYGKMFSKKYYANHLISMVTYTILREFETVVLTEVSESLFMIFGSSY